MLVFHGLVTKDDNQIRARPNNGTGDTTNYRAGKRDLETG